MSNAAVISISIDRSKRGTLVHQLYDATLQLIRDGNLQPGFRMPSSRQFAEELGISRSTVLSAYDQMVAEGYLEPKRGSGLYVLEVGKISYSPTTRTTQPYLQTSVTKEPCIVRPLPLSNGIPDMRLFPHRSWARQISRVARQAPWAFTENESGFGDLMLRTQLAKHLREWRGIPAEPDQVIITAGALDAVELILRTVAGKQQAIAIEDPGYLPLQHICGSMGGNLQFLPVDQYGAVLPKDEAEVPPRVIILTPSFQFPLGVTMPSARKNRFLEYAKRHGGWIIEDDFDSEFRYSGSPVTALASHDGLDRVIYVGSFSKIFSSGLRIGFMVAPKSLLGDIHLTQSRIGTRASSAPQRALAGFMESGEFHKHLRKMRRVYGARRANLVRHLTSKMGEEVDIPDNHAGMQLAVKFRRKIDDMALSRKALERGLSCTPLSKYYRRHTPDYGFVLGYCGHSEVELEEPISKFCWLAKEALQADC